MGGIAFPLKEAAMSTDIVRPLIAGLGAPEILIVVFVIILLFGATKLPELARGSGRALRIFKAETKGLLDDDDAGHKTAEQREIDARTTRAHDTEPDRPRETGARETDTDSGRRAPGDL